MNGGQRRGDLGSPIICSALDRPVAMSNLDNAGFAIAPAAERGTNRKPVHRADDSETGGQSIRSGNLPCTGVVSSPAEVPEFPVAAMSTIAALVVVGGWFVTLRRLRPA